MILIWLHSATIIDLGVMSSVFDLSPLGPPLLVDLAEALHRAADALEGPEHRRALALRRLARPMLGEAEPQEIVEALDRVAVRAQMAAATHAAQDIGSELWGAATMDAAMAAEWAASWK